MNLATGAPAERLTRQTSPLLSWQIVTVVLMVLGYSGYYLCRSNLSVAMPMIIADLESKGIPVDLARIRLGTIASLGVLAYALGKFPSGASADFLGGRRNFLTGMIGSVVFTILFALGGALPVFTLAWIGNRLVQSLGWAGMVKMTSRWFPFSSYGTAMGVISLSYLFGDAASREFMAVLIGRGLGWRAIFLITAAVLLALFLLNATLLKESPSRLGLEEPRSNPLNLFADDGENTAPAGLTSLLRPYLLNKTFWLVCLMSLGMTLVRETFNLWTPTYFTDIVGLTKAAAAHNSALFPLVGGLSVLLSGFLSDRLGAAGRAATILLGLVLTAFTLFGLAYLNFGHSTALPVVLVTLVAFLMIGPYAFLGGAISLDFGGKRGSGTASGMIDGVGYLGGVLAGDSIARISVAHGWNGAFAILACGTLVTSVVASAYLVDQRRAVRVELPALQR
ncbi:MAG TPA: MFS transporter [Blastocatellia bacterium]|nr:MFS transporter [Blastocatellia bacterium]